LLLYETNAFMLSAHGLTCVRGERQLFAGLDLAVEPGQWLHVRGENGSGKTSLLRLLAGLSQPAMGHITWCGQSIREAAEEYRRHLMFLGHQGALKEELTALENLQLSSALDSAQLPDMEALSVLARFGLRGREDFPVRWMSAGQKRRVLLARLLTRKASLWILDEPFTALDVKAVDLLADLIREHLAASGMVILTSHQTIPVPGGRELQL
jgi:heme exporter protein A